MHDHHTGHPHGGGLSSPQSRLSAELVRHLPFSVSAVAIGLTFAGILCFLAPITPAEMAAEESASAAMCPLDHDHEHDHAHEQVAGRAKADGHDHENCADNPFQPLFHLFHPMHMLFSAAATTAMFWRYERRVLKAVVVGLIGAIGVCGLSDIVMPQLSLTMLGMKTHWHICVIEHPTMVLSFAAVGVIIGIGAAPSVRSSTFFSHSLHVFSSTMASILYLIGPFGRLGWIDSVGVIFIFIIIAVMIPCCLSDIVFPLFLAKRAKEDYHHDDQPCCG